jgi:hypothetical protein
VRRLDYFESVKGDQHSCLIYLEFDVTEDVAVQDGKTKLLDTQRVTIVEGPRRRTVLEGSITKEATTIVPCLPKIHYFIATFSRSSTKSTILQQQRDFEQNVIHVPRIKDAMAGISHLQQKASGLFPNRLGKSKGPCIPGTVKMIMSLPNVRARERGKCSLDLLFLP